MGGGTKNRPGAGFSGRRRSPCRSAESMSKYSIRFQHKWHDLKGMERAYLLVQSGSRKKLQKFLGEWRGQLDALPARKVRWALDVDPLEF